MKKPSRDDPRSAPESGTDRNETTGNQPAAPDRRMSGKTADASKGSSKQQAVGRNDDDESKAGEEA